MRAHSLPYALDGAAYVVVASNHGEPRSPSWYHDLRADPRVDITLGTRRLPVSAKIVNPDCLDYPRLWELVNNNAFNRY